METRELYVLSARKLKRYTTSEERAIFDDDTISYSAATINRITDANNDVEISKLAVPKKLVIEKIGNIYRETLGNGIVANLNDNGYENGILIDRKELDKMQPISEQEALEIYSKYHLKTVAISLNIFLCEAMKTYYEKIQAQNKLRLKR